MPQGVCKSKTECRTQEAMLNEKVGVQQYLTSKNRSFKDQVATHCQTLVLWKPWDFDRILGIRKPQERVISKFPSCSKRQKLKMKFVLENEVILSSTEFAELDLPQYPSPPSTQTFSQTVEPCDMLPSPDVTSPLASTITTFLTVIIVGWGLLSSVFFNPFRRQTLEI